MMFTCRFCGTELTDEEWEEIIAYDPNPNSFSINQHLCPDA